MKLRRKDNYKWCNVREKHLSIPTFNLSFVVVAVALCLTLAIDFLQLFGFVLAQFFLLLRVALSSLQSRHFQSCVSFGIVGNGSGS